MYSIYVIFKSYPGKREAFVKKVNSEGIADEIRKENGCILYDYYFSEKNPDEILLIEKWESKEHQQAHLKTPHMEKLRTFKDDYIKSTEIGEFEIK